MFSTTFRRIITATIAAAMLGSTTVALAGAQGTPTTPGPDPTAQATPSEHGRGHDSRAFESGVALGIAAQAIGITPEQLREELPGKSLAQVAQAHGKNPADIATALKNAANQRIDKEAAEGDLTTGEAARRKERVDQHIDEAVYQVGPMAEKTTTPVATPATTPVATPTAHP